MKQESTYIFRMSVGFILNPNSTFIVYTTSSMAGVGFSLPWYVPTSRLHCMAEPIPQIGLFVDPCFRKGLKAAWRRDTGPILPPFITANLNTNANNQSDNSDSTILSTKAEINSSLMPMISYQPDESINQEQHEPKVERRRRTSEMDVVAAATQITPELEAGIPGTGRRGSRKELDDSVL